MTGMKVWWRCLAPSLPPALRVECKAHGVFMQGNSGGDAERHVKATRHPTITTASAEVGERWTGGAS